MYSLINNHMMLFKAYGSASSLFQNIVVFSLISVFSINSVHDGQPASVLKEKLCKIHREFQTGESQKSLIF